ncbi:TatD family hydrolase [Tolumonas lignilytica]|uniref:TatD family hydrolase n=1 Tax=Tolumonas lignilytica TaxID=1283284 RepID=UPI000463B28D|nr:YchF/TatD family DNA exonuclease [Tolumonas lignilytica]
MLVDSHCHLDRLDYEKKHHDVADVLQKAQQQGVTHFLSVSVTLEAFPAMLASVLPFPHVFASCGVHPLDLSSPWSGEQLRELAVNPRVIAIGETGLDYYYSTENKAEQQQAFREHIRVSRELKKPVIVHTRDAKADTLAILKEERAGDVGGVLHCFTEDWNMAKAALELGMYISISGIVTFRNADALREVTRQIPADRLLIETDSPYLAPVPHRGHQNEPAYVADVARFVAELRGVSPELLAEQTSENFFRLFTAAQR